MLSAQRRQQILQRLEQEGTISVAALSREWGLSEDTLRRDLRDLAEEGLIQRVHGGALPRSPALGAYPLRQALSPEIKSRLGRAAAALIRPGQVVGMDGGTSTLCLVQALPPELAFTLVTHSPLIAAALETRPLVETILLGGRLFRHSMVAVGSETAEALQRLRLDLWFLGATGLHPEVGVTTGDWEEAAIKRAFCQASAETYLLLTPEKLGAAAPYRIVGADRLTGLVAPRETEEDRLKPYRELGLEIVLA